MHRKAYNGKYRSNAENISLRKSRAWRGKVRHCFFKVHRGNQEQKDQNRVLMFVKLSAEKTSSTAK